MTAHFARHFLRTLLPSVAMGLAFLPTAGWAAACPTTSNQPVTVTTQTSAQAVNLTAGMISERVSVSATSGSDTTVTPTANVCADSFAGSDADIGPAAIKTRNNLWTSASYNGIRRSDLGGDYHGGITNVVVGYDRKLNNWLIAGLAVGYENVDIITGFDNGTLKGNSGTIAPYVGLVLTDWLVADLAVGYTGIHYDYTKNFKASKGSNSADRYFGSTALTASQRYDRIRLSEQIGYLQLQESQGRYAETDGTNHQDNVIKFGQIHGTISGGYEFRTEDNDTSITPTASVRYDYDVISPSSMLLTTGTYSSRSRSGVVFSLGVEVKTADDISFGLKGTSTQFRANTDAFSVVGNIRYRF
ncbi:MAG: autotransporter outer membrane beta-barrel domain-containing protein [Rhodospirillaceae bacterium]